MPTMDREQEHRHTPINNSFKENKLSRNKSKQWGEEPLKWKLHTSGWKTDKKDTRKWKGISYLWIGNYGNAGYFINYHLKIQCNFNQNPNLIFHRSRKNPF